MQRKPKKAIPEFLNTSAIPSTLQKSFQVYTKAKSKPKPSKNKSYQMNTSMQRGKSKMKVKTKTNRDYEIGQFNADGEGGSPYGRIREDEKTELQMQYFKVIEGLYQALTQYFNAREGSDEGLKKIIPWPILYFLGSVVQKLKAHIQLSYLQFIDECIRIFRRSSPSDILEFINLANSLPKESDSKDKGQEVHQERKQTVKQTPKKLKIEIEEEAEEKKQESEDQEKEVEREREEMKDLLVKSGEKWLKNIPITSSVESKQAQPNPQANPTVNSLASSPIRIISPQTPNQPPPAPSSQYIPAQTRTILSKISSNITKISQNLHLPPPSPKISYPSPHSITNLYKTELLHQKYGKKGHEIDRLKYGCEGKENGGYQERAGARGAGKRARGEIGDDRIDRLAAKVEDYINRNTLRIENNMRDLSRLRRY